jgi:adenylosuccinate synthase
VTEVPAAIEDLFGAEPELEFLEGWTLPDKVQRPADLPASLRRYLERIESATRAPVTAVSAGRDRADVLELS